MHFTLDWIDNNTRVLAYCLDTDCKDRWDRGEGAEIPAEVTDSRIYCVGCGKLLALSRPVAV